MKRVGFVFRIKPALKAEYKKAHDGIWPELVEVIKNSKINNYSIFFRKDGTLFAYLETDAENIEDAFDSSKNEISTKWQMHMEKFFVKEDKSILGPEVEILEEVFHLD